jgi:large repetitive protein
MRVRLFRTVFPLVLLVLLSLSLQGIVAASDINVACDEAELVNAINAANALSDADTLHLSTNCYYVFDFASDIDGTLGDSALPRITTPITIEGNGASLVGPRWSNVHFRLLHIAHTGNLFLNNIRIDQGSSTEGGGGILNNGGILTLKSCAIGDNTAASFGGGIFSTAGSTLEVSNCTFTGNSSAGGGGIRNDGIMTVTQSMLTANTVNGSGGGITNGPEGVATITNSTVASNSSTGTNFGGGIANIGTLTVVDLVLSGNSGTNVGGGLGNSLGSTTIINSTVSGNSAMNGGGIYKFNGTVNIINSTIASNKAVNGGGIDNASSSAVMITNSILYANSSQISGSATAIYSNIQGGFGGTGNLNVDPLFVSSVDFASAPTAVGNYHLHANSPVTDKGSTASLPADTTDLDVDGDTTELLPLDRDGDLRALGTSVDMGADENGGCAAYAFPYTVAAGDSAALMNAIVCANAYPDTNTIILSPSAYNYNNTWEVDALSGGTALPAITTPIVVQGNNATIKRADGSPYLRLLHVTSSGSLSLNDVTVSGGYTYNAFIGGGSNGGNILNDGGVLNIRNSTITSSVGLVGGAIYSSGTTKLIDSAVIDSNAVDGGGGIRSNSGTLAIINSRIAGNGTNDRGGGISSNDSTVTVINSQLTGNGANLEGGAFYSVSDALTIINSTIAGNAAGYVVPPIPGGGVYAENSTLTVKNSIVWGNASQLFSAGGTATVAHSIVEGGFSGTGNLDVDPLFVAPVSYTVAESWPTAEGDYHLQADSPAMNAGNSAALPPDTYDIDMDSNTTELLPIDIDGDWRILDGVVDIGADEASGCTAYTFPYTVAEGDTAALVQAIRCANANPDVSVINLTTSTYSFTASDATNPDSALPRITTPITINANGAALQRDSSAPAFRLLYVASSGNLTLNNITILGGSRGTGGGIENYGGILTISNSRIANNYADSGGGISNIGGTLTVTYTTFSSNSAHLNTGGGIYNLIGSTTVTDSIFTGNKATGGGSPSGGGGIYNRNGTLTVRASTFSSNIASFGGGIADGGGGSGTMTLVTDSILSGNSASHGGGFAHLDGTARLINSIVSGNSATYEGGGLYNKVGTLIVTNSTLSGNSATQGGGIYYSSGTLTVANSIVWGNSTQITGTTTVTYSDVQGGFAGTGNFDLDPMFVSPVAYTSAPTTTGDYHIQADSPALNIGSNAALPQDTFDLDGDSDVIEPVPFDLDDNSRIVNGTVDIGAYEHQTLAGVTVSKAEMTVTEGGTTDTYTIRLNSRPSANVTIDLSTGGQATTAPTPMTFTLSNWSVAQTVTVTAVNDDIMDGPQTDTVRHSVESTDIAYDGITVGSISVSVIDNDTAGITVEPTVAVTEGGATDTYTVVLTSEPTADVMITPTGDTDCLVSGALTFTSVEWDTPQNITVTAVDDDIAEGPHACGITNTALSADPNYNDSAVASVAGTVTDNEAAGVSVGQTVDVTEGGATDTYTVILTSKPSASVTITPIGDTQCTVSAPLTFTDVDWDIPQAVTVTAVDDAIPEGDHICTISHTIASDDTDYDSAEVAEVTGNITDDDPFPSELLDNGGFETAGATSSVPDRWTVKNAAGDKRLCKLGKPYTGQCAFKFSGSIGEKAQLSQNVDLSGVTLSTGDTLTLSAFFKGNNLTAKIKFILVVTYAGNPTPVKSKMTVYRNAVYAQVTLPAMTLSTGGIEAIKVLINHKSTVGNVFIDDVSLIHTPLGGRRSSDILPPPEAPGGFRTGN